MNGTDSAIDIGTVEEQAKRSGWAPQEEFKGDPEKWLPAEKWLERAETVLPIAKSTIREMQRLMAQQEANFKKEMAELKASTGKFVEFAKKSEERAFQRALEELRAKQAAAAEDRDIAGVEDIGKQIEEHIRSHPAVTGKAPDDDGSGSDGAATKDAGNAWIQPGVFEAWKDDNPWFDTKPKMAAYAEQMDRFLMRTKPTQTQRERLNDIAALVREEFPEYWTNPKRAAAGAVEGGGDGASAPAAGKRSYANLVPEARALCDEFTGKDGKGKTGTIEGFTREDYLAQCDPSLFK